MAAPQQLFHCMWRGFLLALKQNPASTVGATASLTFFLILFQEIFVL
jgi:hypothetical protein